MPLTSATTGSVPPLDTLPPKLDASLVIPARNALATLGLTLRGLADQVAAPPFEVIVVDDGSTDGTRELAQSFGGLDLRVLDTTGGEGPGAARNRGAVEARADLLVFIDADCEPEPDWLANLVAAARDAEL